MPNPNPATKHPPTCECKGDGILLVVRPCPAQPNSKRPYFVPVEPDWEQPIADASERICKRLYRQYHGHDVPEGTLMSPAMMSIIENEIRKLVNELTESWH